MNYSQDPSSESLIHEDKQKQAMTGKNTQKVAGETSNKISPEKKRLEKRVETNNRMIRTLLNEHRCYVNELMRNHDKEYVKSILSKSKCFKVIDSFTQFAWEDVQTYLNQK